MKPYPEYKDSGVEWIGEIPVGWEVKKLKYFCLIKSGDGFANDLQGREGLEIPFFKVSDTNIPENKTRMFVSNNSVSQEDVENFNFTLHQINSIVFPKIGATLLLNKRHILTQLSCIDNNMMSLFCVTADYNFIFYVMLNVDFKNYCNIASPVPSINSSDVGDIKVPFPSILEQQQIISYLDEKTQQIDQLIQNKEQKIKLLQEKRTAVINQAVTKGLTPEVEMKDSGVEWIGQIPVGWEMIKVKYIFNLITEKAPKNHDMELLSLYTDIGVEPRKNLEQKGNKASTTDEYWIVKEGDIIVNKLLAWMGAIARSSYNGVTSPAYDILRPVVDIDSKFYHHLFRGGLYLTEFKRRSRGIMNMRLRLYFEELGQILVPCPNLDIQTKIVSYLDDKTQQIDDLIGKEQRKIELLKEYRQSLISDAVTGKIDVREAV